MAQEGVILPREPILIVDKQWRIGKGATDKGADVTRPSDNSNLKVRVMGKAQDASIVQRMSRKRTTDKQRKFRFVQSSHSIRAAHSNTPSPNDGRPQAKQADRSSSEGSSDVFELQDAVARIGGLPGGSSSAFYGHLDEAFTTRYTELLKYYPTTISNSFYPLRSKIIFDVNPIGSIWLPFALQDEALLNTVMLSSAVQIASSSPFAYTEIMRRLSQSSIQIVNQRMRTNILTDATIGAVSCLVLIELQMGHPQRSAIHHSGLLELIRLRGGISSIDPTLQMKIYRAALLPAVDNLERPRLPRLRPSTPPLHAALGLDPGYAAQYAAMLAQQGLDLDLIDVFLAMKQLSMAVEHAMERTTAINQQAFDEDTMNLFHDLLSHPQDDGVSLSNACRHAAIIYLNTLTREGPFLPAICEKVSKTLMTELENLESAYTVDNITFWVAFMGSLTSSFTAERLWFRTRLSTLTRRLNIENWQSCQEQLRTVCWIDKIHDEDGLAVWNEVQYLWTTASAS